MKVRGITLPTIVFAADEIPVFKQLVNHLRESYEGEETGDVEMFERGEAGIQSVGNAHPELVDRINTTIQSAMGNADIVGLFGIAGWILLRQFGEVLGAMTVGDAQLEIQDIAKELGIVTNDAPVAIGLMWMETIVGAL